jgi:hypothetical protein
MKLVEPKKGDIRIFWEKIEDTFGNKFTNPRGMLIGENYINFKKK